MNSLKFYILFLLTFFYVVAYSQEAVKMGHDKLRLIWSDEFDYNGYPDSLKWTYEEGLVRNQEPQYYTKKRLENCRVENGHLVIEARHENYRNAQFTSASITTAGKFQWQYGRIEVRAKVPTGQGVWPAIWMKGSNQLQGISWPYCGEIDILEYVGKDPNTVWQTVHYDLQGYVCNTKKTYMNIPVDEDYHVYSIDWNEHKMIFAVDHIETHVVDLSIIGKQNNPFHKPFFLLLNLALGSYERETMAGTPNPLILPAKYYVDYVRVYQR